MPLIDEGPGWRVEKTLEGVIRARVSGNATDAEVKKYLDVWQRVIEENAPCLHLLDASQLDLSDLASRWELAARMKQNRELFKKSAVVGVTGAKRFMGQVVVKASGRSNVKFFDDDDAATRWLLQDD
jgi:hypothetical protein